MAARFELIEDLSKGRVHFYTVQLGEDQPFEFEKFEDKEFPEHQEEVQILYMVIQEMGYRGAQTFYFKPEGPANALPKVSAEIMAANEHDYGLRLYCVRLTEELVVLLNGSIKTNIDPEQCPNVRPHFRMAIRIAKALDKAVANREINFDHDYPFEGLELEV